MPKPMRSRKLAIDFTGVEAGGRSCPDGRYVGKIKSVEQKDSESSGKPMLAFKWTVQGAMIYDNCSLQPQALFNLKNLLTALGFDGLDGSYELDPNELVGQECGVEITNEEYNGKNRPRITDFFPADQVGEDQEETTTAAPAAEKGKAPTIKVGSKVKFKDDEGKVQKGVVTAISGDNATVDVNGEEWEVELENLS